MSNLETARKSIEEIDKTMAELFVKRMRCAEVIANYKNENGLPILDESREKALIARNEKYIDDLMLRPYYTQYIKAVMDISKRYQHKLIEGARVAYSGIEGAFANIAATRLFPDGELVSYRCFKDAYQSVMNGDCDLAVLPIENSYAGEVGQVMDLMFEGDLFINGVYGLRISQNLLGIKGSTPDSIKKVISHPQALEQCADYIAEHEYEIIQTTNTAIAAKQVADMKDKEMAAIASKETAKLYGLSVLDHDINENQSNTTRFAVFSRCREEVINASDYNTFIMMFTVKNEAGTLADAIQVIGKYGFSMNVLRSRPLKNLPWQYYFYSEVVGNLASKKVGEMLSELNEYCESIKILGSFSTDKEL